VDGDYVLLPNLRYQQREETRRTEGIRHGFLDFCFTTIQKWALPRPSMEIHALLTFELVIYVAPKFEFVQ
jgi:hypothetical protein